MGAYSPFLLATVSGKQETIANTSAFFVGVQWGPASTDSAQAVQDKQHSV